MLKAINFRQKATPIHFMAHLIFWSFIPWVQLKRKRQASEVEMEQLLCSIVNCTQGKEKRKVLKKESDKIKKTHTHKIIWGKVLCRVPPGCVAPNDWSICSIVGAMAWELKWTPLKTHTHTSINIQTGRAALLGELSQRCKQVSLNESLRDALQQQESTRETAAINTLCW